MTKIIGPTTPVTKLVKLAKKHGVFIGVLNIMTHPGKILLTWPLQKLFEKRYRDRYRHARKIFLLDMFLLATIIVLAGLAIYFGYFFNPFINKVPLNLAVLPRKVADGGDVIIRITFANLSDVKLLDTSIKVIVPDNVVIKESSENFDIENSIANIGQLLPEEEGVVRLLGEIHDQVGSTKTVSALMQFVRADNGKIYTNALRGKISVTEPTLLAKLNIPKQIIRGQEFESSIYVKNNSKDAVTDVLLVPLVPSEFTFSKSIPKFDPDRVWRIGTLNAQEEKSIIFSGTLGPGEEPFSEFKVLTSLERDGEVIRQSEVSFRSEVIDPKIEFSLVSPPFVKPGEVVKLNIHLTNRGNSKAKNSRILIKLDGELWDLSSINIGEIREGAIILEPTHWKGLTELLPGSSKEAVLEIKTLSSLPETAPFKENMVLLSRAEMQTEIVNEETKNIKLRSKANETRVTTILSLQAQARYWSETGDQLGRGPIPPRVDEPTKYWVFMSVGNLWNPLSETRVSARLPNYISWTGKASVPVGEPLNFDPINRNLIWLIGNVPAYPGITKPSVTAAFEVVIIPSEDQIGTSPKLISGFNAWGKDTRTGQVVSASFGSLTTDLKDDPKASLKGKVVP